MVYKEQAGFRSKRSKTKRIFILRNILERANEWRTRLYVHFVDFEKAFDSVHRESFWKIVRSYGTPHKMVRGITNIYQDFDCAVVDGSETSDWFKSVMPGFLFLLALDTTMRDRGNGAGGPCIDFADDIALLVIQV